MPKAELGTKRICPVTGKKFYDLGKDPIVSPYTGQGYPRAYFDPQPKLAKVEEADEDDVAVEGPGAELVPLEDADEADVTKAVPDEDIDLDDDDDDTFLAPEEDEDDNNVSDLIDGDIEEDEES
ncbi:MAG: TIGR02300 family protein [Proteobacteria bacterium]|nr:TIGR02300 family protein [Pseudomonadota bacterium]